MTTPLSSETPLVLLSEFRAQIAQSSTSNAGADAKLRTMAIEISQAMQAICRRRFDEYVETRYYTPRHIDRDGDLYSVYDLWLDADLKSVTSITNGDTSSIASGYTLYPANSFAKSQIRLNPYGTVNWVHSGSSDPYGSIAVTGIWGYGGSWVDTGATTAEAVDASEPAIDVSNGTLLEVGMIVKYGTAGTEYNRIDSISSNTITVTRGYNGSTATAANTSTAIYRFKPLPEVQRLMKRLLAWANAQDASPLFGQATIGDFSFPVQVDSLPKDVLAIILQSGLVRRRRFQAV